MKVTGRKDDQTKPRWDLLPLDATASIVDVLTFGAEKYAPENWRLVPNGYDRYFAAAMRHLVAARKGNQYDDETGLPHLAHAACCLLFMLELEEDEKEVAEESDETLVNVHLADDQNLSVPEWMIGRSEVTVTIPDPYSDPNENEPVVEPEPAPNWIDWNQRDAEKFPNGPDDIDPDAFVKVKLYNGLCATGRRGELDWGTFEDCRYIHSYCYPHPDGIGEEVDETPDEDDRWIEWDCTDPRAFDVGGPLSGYDQFDEVEVRFRNGKPGWETRVALIPHFYWGDCGDYTIVAYRKVDQKEVDKSSDETPDEGGEWIEWTAEMAEKNLEGPPDLDDETSVQVRWRDGNESINTFPRCCWAWGCHGTFEDIVAYRKAVK